MPSFPITLSVPSSLSKKGLPPSVLREYATQIENYINNHNCNEPVCEFDYGELASEIGIDKEVIRRYLAPKGGGSHGITMTNPKRK
jgi:hypothetical protein